MRYGFYLPTRGPTATRAGILALAREGERLGLHSAMIADHIVFPVESESAYPYTGDRKHPRGGDALETVSILGAVAGVTEKLRLVTSVRPREADRARCQRGVLWRDGADGRPWTMVGDVAVRADAAVAAPDHRLVAAS